MAVHMPICVDDWVIKMLKWNDFKPNRIIKKLQKRIIKFYNYNPNDRQGTQSLDALVDMHSSLLMPTWQLQQNNAILTLL